MGSQSCCCECVYRRPTIGLGGWGKGSGVFFGHGDVFGQKILRELPHGGGRGFDGFSFRFEKAHIDLAIAQNEGGIAEDLRVADLLDEDAFGQIAETPALQRETLEFRQKTIPGIGAAVGLFFDLCVQRAQIATCGDDGFFLRVVEIDARLQVPV